MLILPAIDLRGGRVVRLLRGRFDAETAYGDDPAAQARAFAQAGARWLHVVDLDGARDGAARQTAAIAALAGVAGLRVQAGGGVRSVADVEALLGAGVARVVVGSLAAYRPDLVRSWLARFGPERLTVALDVELVGGEPIVLARGWQERSGVTLWEALDALGPEVAHLLVTDVATDGTMTEPNLELARAVMARRPGAAFQASGGVARLADIARLRAAGVPAVIIGRALYEGAFVLADALAVAEGRLPAGPEDPAAPAAATGASG
jgi:phosphoribosylformimino-5-aminoimidazole carboxamide ribotide isomerase